MIDAGVWGQLPSYINGGVFADAQPACLSQELSAAGCAHCISSGTTILISQTMTTRGNRVNLAGSMTVLFAGTGLAKTLSINIDGTDVAVFNYPNVAVPIPGAVAYSGALAAGSHTFQLRFFDTSTGLGLDSISDSSFLIQDCI
jgi:hypothetical protein